VEDLSLLLLPFWLWRHPLFPLMTLMACGTGIGGDPRIFCTQPLPSPPLRTLFPSLRVPMSPRQAPLFLRSSTFPSGVSSSSPRNSSLPLQHPKFCFSVSNFPSFRARDAFPKFLHGPNVPGPRLILFYQYPLSGFDRRF